MLNMNRQGIGSLGAISTISEDSTIEAKNVTFELWGIPSNLVSEVLWETRLLYTAQAYFALWDTAATSSLRPF